MGSHGINNNDDGSGSKYGSLDPTPSSVATHQTQTPTSGSMSNRPNPLSEPEQVPRPAVRKRNYQKSAGINNDLIFNDHKPDQMAAYYAPNDQHLMPANREQNKSPSDPTNIDNNRLHNQELLGLQMLPSLGNNSKLGESSPIMRQQNNNSPTSNATEQTLALSVPPTELKSNDFLDRSYPKKVFLIVGNEFCERFSYYGLRTVLVLYFKSVLGFSDAKSTVSFHLFATLCYMTPILGAILGDSIFGKFKTILYLSFVYLIGEVVLVVSSIFWDQGVLSTGLTFSGLILIGLGTGGIKPCVSALGGDQFLPHEDKWRQTFFSLFYGAINLGSLLSMFLTPLLRSEVHCVNRSDCYPLAFGLPCLLMFIGTVIFLVGHSQYHVVPLPERNVILAFCQCFWLALKRKLAGQKLSQIDNNHTNETNNTSSSNLSMSSNEDVLANKQIILNQAYSLSQKQHLDQPFNVVGAENRFSGKLQLQRPNSMQSDASSALSDQVDWNHWLYLASDQFDSNSIEDFRCVLGILFLFLPLPVYWCLFDQQGSLWTLQATRMDGRIFNTGFVLEPDQMSVANPLLLLAFIPIFELIIYPGLSRLSTMTRPIPRITVGGFLAALTFIVSAMIEIHIEQSLPPMVSVAGRANLLLVNGLSDCSIVNPVISYVQIPKEINSIQLTADNLDVNNGMENKFLDGVIKPLSSSRQLDIPYTTAGQNKIQFKLTEKDIVSSTVTQLGFNNDTSSSNQVPIGCPFGSQANQELIFGPLSESSVNLIYLEQGNGKLNYKLLNESLDLPPASKARVRLLYESFGSVAQAEKRKFYLVKTSSLASAGQQSPRTNQSSMNQQSLQIPIESRDGQLFVSAYLDVAVPTKGESFVLQTSDQLIRPTTANQHVIFLEPGTRNLLVVHQKDYTNVAIEHQVLQDNSYRVSMLYQLIPYLLISASEVMFSITGLEFSYSMAPDSMKSVILAAWCLTTAFGNVLTVAVESMHLFPSVTYDFLFYATIMALDMVLFAYLGSRYKPYRQAKSSK